MRPVKLLTVDKWFRGGSRIFFRRGALVSCSTSTPINHIVFFGRIPVVLENRTVTNIVDQFVHTEIKGRAQSFVNCKDQVQYVYYGKTKTVHQN